MTIQDVDPQTFYDVGRRLFELAGDVYKSFQSIIDHLSDTGAMAGSDDDGTAWASSYDARAAEVLGAANDLIGALENYGGVLIQAGYNHAVYEHRNAPNASPPPQRPAEPASEAGQLTAPPAAGGPGSGLIEILGLVEQIGMPVPDGDTGKIDKAAGAWGRLATARLTATIVESLELSAARFTDTRTAEMDYIAQHLRDLRDGARAVLDGCGELSESCKEYRAALDELRGSLKGILESLAVEIALTAAIGIAASFVSVGAGAVAAAAKTAEAIKRTAGTIRTALTTWKIAKNISAGVKKAHDIAGVRQKLQRIKNLGRKGQNEEPAPTPKPPPKPDPQFEYNTRPERLDHTFAPKHKLDGVVERLGGREETIREMLNGLKDKVPQQGVFEQVITVSGEQVTVRGFVDNGVIKISTAFIP